MSEKPFEKQTQPHFQTGQQVPTMSWVFILKWFFFFFAIQTWEIKQINEASQVMIYYDLYPY